MSERNTYFYFLSSPLLVNFMCLNSNEYLFVEVKFKDKDLARVTEYKVRVGVKVRHASLEYVFDASGSKALDELGTRILFFSFSSGTSLPHLCSLFSSSCFRLHKAHWSWIAIRMAGSS